VRVHISGAVRPNAILIPQEAVLQGAKGHFVIVLDKDDKAQIRPVQVGPWHDNDWFIDSGLADGDTVVVDGVAKLAPGAAVKIVGETKPEAPKTFEAPSPPSQPRAAVGSIGVIGNQKK
jgi:membrane fusion protein (multidrug efflux system)